MLKFYNFSSIYWCFLKNVSYLCHSDKRKTFVLHKNSGYGTLQIYAFRI